MSALLELDKVSVRLRATHALKGVSLTVRAGEIIALLGPNGAGKTTLMRASLGLVPVEGARALGGADPAKLTNRERALRVAYLPQRPQSIWPISVVALVALGRFAHGAAPDRLSATDQAAVDAAIEACGLNNLRVRGMDEISGGEKARAHLARALAQHAPLLMLDEPTAGLDPAQSLAVADILRAHAADGGAVVFSTHDIALAASAAHRVVLMHEGRIWAEGEPEKALTRDALEVVYGRPGQLERIGDAFAAIFR
ncbi:MAG: ABC transporter ATP-binding protein [Hyphomonadaceae bacterium JAD_PAG50586_4]|nr:MAG: ABC transporter ATP-binding protein [Hyphomonadaceae bacterium JAD_PAG50586_4]